MDLVELRLASINLLLSMIGLPLHFLNQPLPGTEHSVLCIYEREEERERMGGGGGGGGSAIISSTIIGKGSTRRPPPLHYTTQRFLILPQT